MTTESLIEDLGPFADPGTSIKIRDEPLSWEVLLTKDASERRYFVRKKDGHVERKDDINSSFSGLSSLLASPDFADIRWMKEIQRQTSSMDDASDLLAPETQIEIEESISDNHDLASALLPDASQNRLTVAVIDGPAGVGKTTQIARLGSLRAREPGAIPILHVTSRGRRLTNLPDALAQSTSAFRFKFFYDQVPALVRHNVIQVAIDGFDELVDADGYRDAWLALAAFFDDIKFGGPVILSGRDTFFNAESFLDQFFRGPRNVHLIQAHLLPVSVDRARRFLISSGWEKSAVEDDLSSYLKEESYALRPFFLSQIASLQSWENITPPATSLRTFLVQEMVRRESELTGPMVQMEPYEFAALFWNLLGEVALDMAQSESDSIDLDVLALLTELTFEERLSPGSLAKLRNKSAGFAILEKDVQSSRRRFTHSEIANVCLAWSLLHHIGDSTTSRFLRRGLLPLELQDAIQDVGSMIDLDTLKRDLAILQSMSSEPTVSDKLAVNAAAILFALADHLEEKRPFHIANRQFSEMRAPYRLSNARFENVQIGRFDARESDLRLLEFASVTIGSLIVDRDTLLPDLSNVEIGYIEISSKGQSLSLTGPRREQWLAAHAERRLLSQAAASPTEIEQLLERICRKALRVFYLAEGEESFGPSVLENKNWPIIREILERHDRIEMRAVAARGPRRLFFHIVDAASLLTRARDEDRLIWEEVSAFSAI